MYNIYICVCCDLRVSVASIQPSNLSWINSNHFCSVILPFRDFCPQPKPQIQWRTSEYIFLCAMCGCVCVRLLLIQICSSVFHLYLCVYYCVFFSSFMQSYLNNRLVVSQKISASVDGRCSARLVFQPHNSIIYFVIMACDNNSVPVRTYISVLC